MLVVTTRSIRDGLRLLHLSMASVDFVVHSLSQRLIWRSRLGRNRLSELSARQRLVLAALAAEQSASFAPVQVQKLFFLLDRNVAADIGGPQFSFEPYDYGPFDRAVYSELEALSRAGLVRIEPAAGADRRKYSLTPEGFNLGAAALARFSPRAREYIVRAASWVRSISFSELVGAIYKQYPEMKINSVFRG